MDQKKPKKSGEDKAEALVLKGLKGLHLEGTRPSVNPEEEEYFRKRDAELIAAMKKEKKAKKETR